MQCAKHIRPANTDLHRKAGKTQRHSEARAFHPEAFGFAAEVAVLGQVHFGGAVRGEHFHGGLDGVVFDAGELHDLAEPERDDAGEEGWMEGEEAWCDHQ